MWVWHTGNTAREGRRVLGALGPCHTADPQHRHGGHRAGSTTDHRLARRTAGRICEQVQRAAHVGAHQRLPDGGCFPPHGRQCASGGSPSSSRSCYYQRELATASTPISRGPFDDGYAGSDHGHPVLEQQLGDADLHDPLEQRRSHHRRHPVTLARTRVALSGASVWVTNARFERRIELTCPTGLLRLGSLAPIATRCGPVTSPCTGGGRRSRGPLPQPSGDR